MRRVRAAVVIAFVLLAGVECSARAQSHLLPANNLECDAMTQPMAVESAAPQLEWRLAAASADAHGVRQGAYRVLVASSRKLLDADTGDIWDSGRVASDATFGIPYRGKTLQPEAVYFWKVMVWDERGEAAGWSGAATWTMAPRTWTAKWIAQRGTTNETAEMPLFRHDFRVKKNLVRAVLDVSALGQGEVHLNGVKVGNAELAPAWTDYRKTIRYDAYDVTSLLREGKNAIGVMVGNGMFNVVRTPHRFTKLVNSFGRPMVLAQMRLTYADGSSQVVATDRTWKTAPGPITFSSTYGGEDYDATKAQTDWDSAGFQATGWKRAEVVQGPGGQLRAEVAPPLRVMKTYAPVKKTEVKPGIAVYDLGQNFAGWPDVSVKGTAGAVLKMTPGELLNADGTVSQQSSGAGRRGSQWYSYTVGRSGDEEQWHPHFGYYGFRYVQVEWTSGAGEVLSLRGDAVHSSSPETGEFESSNTMLNAIHKLIVEAMYNNEVSIFTDCPHREKLGWLEETHLVAPGLLFNNDLRGLYRATEENIADEQKPDGMVPTIAPEYTVFAKQGYGVFDDSPEWGSASVLGGWAAYRAYGDTAALKSEYPVMQRYVKYLAGRAQDGIVAYGLGDWYDIGPGSPGVAKNTSLGVTGTLMLYQDEKTMEKIARVLGKDDDARKYAEQAAQTAAAFNAKFFRTTTGEYDRGSQTANAMPLDLGIVPADHRAEVLAHVVADIHAHNYHVTTGEVGYPYMLRALMDNGENDLLMAMMLRKDPPSYGSQLAAGATSLTEAWDANPHSSQDHFMLGGAEEWFDLGLGGIDFDMSRAKDERIMIRPRVVSGVNWVRSSYDSRIGMVRSAWMREDGGLTLEITVPANASATVWVPVRAGESVVSGGNAADATKLGAEEGSDVYRVTSGTHRFMVKPS